MILGGKCRKCKSRISLIHPFIESFTAFVFWLSYLFFFNFSVHYMIMTVVFLSILISLVFIDLFHMILPDELTVGGAVLFLIYSFFNPRLSVLNSFATAFGGALFFAALYFFYLKVRKIEGLGFGDVKMMLLLGAFLGVSKTVIAVMLASVSGLVVGVFFIIFYKKDLKFALPFGTFLGFGAFLSLFWGERILLFIRSLVVN
jgi:leader peptidase (prepilin peptidase)/N-methyltransferase